MSFFYTPAIFKAIDVSDSATIWTQDADGTQRRKTNSAQPLTEMAQMLNHLLSRCPRVIAQQCQLNSNIDLNGSNVLYQWKYFDAVDNARSVTVRILLVPTPAVIGTDQCNITDSFGGALISSLTDISTYYYPNDLLFVQFRSIRGVVTDAMSTYNVATYNGFSVADIVVQEDTLTALDTSVHTYAATSYAQAGIAVQNVELADLRDMLHEVRKTNLPMMISWAAQGVANTYLDYVNISAPPGDHRGFFVQSNTQVNLLDQSETDRTADSPGVMCPACYMGVGAEDETAGKSVTLQVNIFGKCVGNMNGHINIVGPDHVADNWAEINITNSETADYPTWHSANVKLCTFALDSWTNTMRNKVDILARVTETNANLYIQGITGQVMWG